MIEAQAPTMRGASGTLKKVFVCNVHRLVPWVAFAILNIEVVVKSVVNVACVALTQSHSNVPLKYLDSLMCCSRAELIMETGYGCT
jgi:hypothetical protein